MATLESRRDWAEEEDETLDLPAPQSTRNKDGSETITSYRINEDGQKVKVTRRIRKVTVKHVVNPRVAERKTWAKFGDEKGKPSGPQTDTTSIGENIVFRPSTNWRASQKQEESPMEQKKASLKDAKIKCRICSGEHWTSKCPFKDTMAPDGEMPGAPTDLMDAPSAGGGGGGGATVEGSSYVPPQLRGKAGVAGERMGGGKYQDREDLATLRVTNVSEWAEEHDLREMFSRFGYVQRVFLAKDRDTGRAKGFAFISFSDRDDAAMACSKMDGFGYNNLILKVEFAKKST